MPLLNVPGHHEVRMVEQEVFARALAERMSKDGFDVSNPELDGDLFRSVVRMRGGSALFFTERLVDGRVRCVLVYWCPDGNGRTTCVAIWKRKRSQVQVGDMVADAWRSIREQDLENVRRGIPSWCS